MSTNQEVPFPFAGGRGWGGKCQGYRTGDLIENYHPDHLTWAIPDEWYTYENALPSLSLCYGSSRKYNHHFTPQGRKVLGFTIHIVCYLLHSYPVECYFSKKSSYSSLPFFFAR